MSHNHPDKLLISHNLWLIKLLISSKCQLQLGHFKQVYLYKMYVHIPKPWRTVTVSIIRLQLITQKIGVIKRVSGQNVTC